MTVVVLGNDKPVQYRDPTEAEQKEARKRHATARPELSAAALDELAAGKVRESVSGRYAGYRRRATEIILPDGVRKSRAFADITAGQGVWAQHSDAPGPAWVASDDENLAGWLAQEYGCPVRTLDLDDLRSPAKDKTAEPKGGAAKGRSVEWHLRTAVGTDFLAAQMSGSASATAVAKYMALTANSTTPASADTTLTGEITTAGGGLLRASSTYAHTTGTSTYTLTVTYTANSSDSLPVTVAKVGVFTASSSGTMVFETLLSSTATLSASGDQVTVTFTVTLS